MGANDFIKGALLNPKSLGADIAPPEDRRIIKIDPNKEGVKIEKIELQPLKKKAENIEYSEAKKKYGPLAATDKERAARRSEDKRFDLDDRIKKSLAVADEETRVIEARVKQRMSEIEAEVRAKAEKQGYADGYEVGKSEAQARFKEEATRNLEKIEATFREVDCAKEILFKANERYLMELVVAVIKKVLLRELSVDQDYLSRLATHLIQRSGARESIKVRIAPQDAEMLETVRGGILSKLGELKNVDIAVSPEVRQGGCIVDTDWSQVDASLASQLEEIHQALTQTENPA